MGLSPGKTTSGTIPRNQQDFLITNPASVVEYAPDFYIPMMGSPKLCSVVEGLEEVFRSHVTSFHEEYKAARRILISEHPGRR